jgi:8-oxo-dGTP pyrophosphatase MutT (NUDIX family)
MDPVLSPIRLASIQLTIRAAPLMVPPAAAEAIASHWARRSKDNPTLFNGSAFLFDRFAVDAEAGTLVAEGAPTDFATFLYWRHHREELLYTHAFPVGAIVTADKRLIIGRMSQHTANAGKHYPPAGSFDANDLIPGTDGTGTLDPLANIEREVAEEIGLDIGSLTPDPDWLLLPSTPRAHAIIKILRTSETSAALAPALHRHIAEDPHQELEDLLFVDLATRFTDGSASPYVNHLLAYLEVTR